MDLARRGNEFLTKKEPWKTVKSDPDAARNTIHTMLRLTSTMSYLMSPFMPGSAQKLYKMLGHEGEVSKQSWKDALSEPRVGTVIRKPRPLFRKLDIDSVLAQEKEAGMGDAGVVTKKARPVKETVGFDHFKAIDLRIGKIVKVEAHPDAKKLFVITVDIGTETRQMVAGLRKHYRAEDLEGKSIAVVVNLEAANIRGIRSEAMLLAAEGDDGTVSLIVPDGDIEPGSRIY